MVVGWMDEVVVWLHQGMSYLFIIDVGKTIDTVKRIHLAEIKYSNEPSRRLGLRYNSNIYLYLGSTVRYYLCYDKTSVCI